MIVGVGLDLVSVERVERLWRRHGERFLNRVFLPEELAEALSRPRPAESLAARFAAKEAFVKAFPGRAAITQVGVVADPRPRLVYRGPLAERVGELGIRGWVSLAHERGRAMALVVLERPSGASPAPGSSGPWP